MKYSEIGGQAVIEGIMMKGKKEYAIAVRKPDQEIEVKKVDYVGLTQRYKVLGLPIVRGVVNFIESLKIGMQTLTYSAGFYEEEDEKPSTMEKTMENVSKEKVEAVLMGITIIIALILAVGIFIMLPFFISELFKTKIASHALRGLVEGAIRITIFVSYVKAITLMKDIKRVFMYHGAEHKAINCIENGMELTVHNIKQQTKEHKRCGTSFMLIVMFISILFFMFIQVDNIWLRLVFRLLLIPIIAGVSYEFLRFTGKRDSRIIHILIRPGMWLQRLTTKEPDEEMIEVAIASVEAVLDWRAFIQETNVEGQSSKEQIASSMEQEEKSTFDYLDLEDDDEEDEILKALDRYFDAPPNEKNE